MQLDSWLGNLVAGCLNGTPEVMPAQWAAENVFLDKSETPKPGFYDIAQTPWAKRVMECAMDPAVRECHVMKSSRTGVTEAVLNVIRWMPGYKPGPVLYAINSDEKAKRVMQRRVEPHIRNLWPQHMTGDEDDVTAKFIKLNNMEITASGSGSASVFMEGWFWLICLDELEEHDQSHEDTTVDRARGRQTTLDECILYTMCKPQLEGGPIHVEYKRGSQEKYHVPCPHCGELQELVWDFLRFDHCKDLTGNYDLDRVREETFYECRHCHEAIDEKHKRALINDPRAVFIPEPEHRRDGEGKAEHGVVSLHLSDLYSLHSEVSWGKLAVQFLNAYKLKPTPSARKWFWTNHLGKPWEIRKASMRKQDLDKLQGGYVMQLEDGTRRVLGTPYKWVYRDGKQVAPLPIKPMTVTMTVDKQGNLLKGTVFFWDQDWQAYPVEYFIVHHEDDVLKILDERVYINHDDMEEFGIDCGLIDSRYKPKDVFRACIKSRGRLFPSMGMVGSEAFRGKHIKAREDLIDGDPILIYDYFNHAVESDFYLGKIKDMSEPRLWLPVDVGDEYGREWCSAKLIVKNGKEIWDKDPDVPNDFGDTGKMQYVLREILLAEGVF